MKGYTIIKGELLGNNNRQVFVKSKVIKLLI